MLRPPERLLASLNHLRLFVKAKVYQLTKPPPPADPPAVVFNLAIAKQAIQQQIIQNQLTLYQQTRFLKAIQERFPIVNVFASPTLRPIPAFQPSFLSRGTRQPFQLRTITSNPSVATTVGGHFPRSAFAGYGSPGFARNFSSAKATTFFNSNTGTAVNGPANIFAQYSTRPFVAASKANIVNQPVGSHNSSASLKVGRVEDEVKQEAKREQQCHSACNAANKPGYKLFAGDSKGIFEVVLCAEKSDVRARKPRLVRRVTAIRHAAVDKMIKPETTDLVAQPQPTEPHPRSIDNDLKEAMHDDIIANPRAVAAEPPDRALRSNTKRKKARASTTYISIPFDVVSLADVETLPTSRPGSPSAQLDTSLIRSVEDVAQIYQEHFRTVAYVLRTLKQYGEFEVAFVGCEMRVLFPPRHVIAGKGAENWDREGIEQWLKSVGIDPESRHFTVKTATNEESNHDEEEEEEEDQGMQDKSSFFLQQALADTMPDGDAILFDASEDSDDDLVIVPSLDVSIISVSTSGSQTPVGPAYFRRLQEFLDDVNYRIETGPAFLSGALRRENL